MEKQSQTSRSGYHGLSAGVLDFQFAPPTPPGIIQGRALYYLRATGEWYADPIDYHQRRKELLDSKWTPVLSQKRMGVSECVHYDLELVQHMRKLPLGLQLNTLVACARQHDPLRSGNTVVGYGAMDVSGRKGLVLGTKDNMFLVASIAQGSELDVALREQDINYKFSCHFAPEGIHQISVDDVVSRHLPPVDSHVAHSFKTVPRLFDRPEFNKVCSGALDSPAAMFQAYSAALVFIRKAIDGIPEAYRKLFQFCRYMLPYPFDLKPYAQELLQPEAFPYDTDNKPPYERRAVYNLDVATQKGIRVPVEQVETIVMRKPRHNNNEDEEIQLPAVVEEPPEQISTVDPAVAEQQRLARLQYTQQCDALSKQLQITDTQEIVDLLAASFPDTGDFRPTHQRRSDDSAEPIGLRTARLTQFLEEFAQRQRPLSENTASLYGSYEFISQAFDLLQLSQFSMTQLAQALQVAAPDPAAWSSVNEDLRIDMGPQRALESQTEASATLRRLVPLYNGEVNPLVFQVLSGLVSLLYFKDPVPEDEFVALRPEEESEECSVSVSAPEEASVPVSSPVSSTSSRKSSPAPQTNRESAAEASYSEYSSEYSQDDPTDVSEYSLHSDEDSGGSFDDRNAPKKKATPQKNKQKLSTSDSNSGYSDESTSEETYRRRKKAAAKKAATLRKAKAEAQKRQTAQGNEQQPPQGAEQPRRPGRPRKNASQALEVKQEPVKQEPYRPQPGKRGRKSKAFLQELAARCQDGDEAPVTLKQFQQVYYSQPTDLRGSVDGIWADRLVQFIGGDPFTEGDTECFQVILPILSLITDNIAVPHLLALASDFSDQRANPGFWVNVQRGHSFIGGVPIRFYNEFYNTTEFDELQLKPCKSEIEYVVQLQRVRRRLGELITHHGRTCFQKLPAWMKLRLLDWLVSRAVQSRKYYDYVNSLEQERLELNKARKEMKGSTEGPAARAERRAQAAKEVADLQASLKSEEEKLRKQLETNTPQRNINATQRRILQTQKLLEQAETHLAQGGFLSEREKAKQTEDHIARLTQLMNRNCLGQDCLGNQYFVCFATEDAFVCLQKMDGELFIIMNQDIEAVASAVGNSALEAQLLQLAVYDVQDTNLLRHVHTTEQTLIQKDRLTSTDINQFLTSQELPEIFKYAALRKGFRKLCLSEKVFGNLASELWTPE